MIKVLLKNVIIVMMNMVIIIYAKGRIVNVFGVKRSIRMVNKRICRNCGHSEDHMNPFDESIPSFCHHRNSNGNYDCDCKKFVPKEEKIKGED